MKKILLIILLFPVILSADFFDDLSYDDETYVVISKNATKKEKAAAKYIADHLIKNGSYDDILITDEYLFKFFFFFFDKTLITVGTPKTNKLLSLPSVKSIKVLKKNGIYTKDYGHFFDDADVGLILSETNPLSVQTTNLTAGMFPLSDMIIITGSEDKLMDAAKRFIRNKALSSVIADKDSEIYSMDYFHIGKENIVEELPKAIRPKKVSVVVKEQTLEYAGWMMGALQDYRGLQNALGAKPKKVIHLKYRHQRKKYPKEHIKLSNSNNTLMVVEYHTEKQTLAAITNFSKKYKLDFKVDPKKKVEGYTFEKKGSWWIHREGKYLVFENIHPHWKEAVRNVMNKLFDRAPKLD